MSAGGDNPRVNIEFYAVDHTGPVYDDIERKDRRLQERNKQRQQEAGRLHSRQRREDLPDSERRLERSDQISRAQQRRRQRRREQEEEAASRVALSERMALLNSQRRATRAADRDLRASRISRIARERITRPPLVALNPPPYTDPITQHRRRLNQALADDLEAARARKRANLPRAFGAGGVRGRRQQEWDETYAPRISDARRRSGDLRTAAERADQAEKQATAAFVETKNAQKKKFEEKRKEYIQRKKAVRTGALYTGGAPASAVRTLQRQRRDDEARDIFESSTVAGGGAPPVVPPTAVVGAPGGPEETPGQRRHRLNQERMQRLAAAKVARRAEKEARLRPQRVRQNRMTWQDLLSRARHVVTPDLSQKYAELWEGTANLFPELREALETRTMSPEMAATLQSRGLSPTQWMMGPNRMELEEKATEFKQQQREQAKRFEKAKSEQAGPWQPKGETAEQVAAVQQERAARAEATAANARVVAVRKETKGPSDRRVWGMLYEYMQSGVPKKKRRNILDLLAGGDQETVQDAARMMGGGTTRQWQQQATVMQKQGWISPTGQIRKSAIAQIMQYVEWRMLRFASLLVVYYGMMRLMQAWYKTGFLIEVANQKSQKLARTWGQLREQAQIIGQGIARDVVEGVPALAGITRRMSAQYAARTGADEKYPLARLRDYFTSRRGSALEQQKRHTEEYERLRELYLRHPEKMIAARMPVELAQSRLGWAEAQIKSTPRGAETLRTLAASIKQLQSAIELGLKGEVDPIKRYQLMMQREQVNVRAQEIRGLAAGGQKADYYSRRAETQRLAMESMFPGFATVGAYRQYREELKKQIEYLLRAKEKLTEYSDAWMDNERKLSEARRALLPTEREVIRRVGGMSAQRLAEAGVGEGFLGQRTGIAGGYFVHPELARPSPAVQRKEIRVKFENMSPEEIRLLSREMGVEAIRRYSAQNSGWEGGMGGGP